VRRHDTEANRRTAFDRIDDALEALVDLSQIAALADLSLR
jgi:hypothetical protein